MDKKEPYWKLETESWDSSYFKIESIELGYGSVFKLIKSDGWNGKKENYRLERIDADTYELQTNLNCGEPCEWQRASIIKRIYPN
jgi:hypothetical protein